MARAVGVRLRGRLRRAGAPRPALARRRRRGRARRPLDPRVGRRSHPQKLAARNVGSVRFHTQSTLPRQLHNGAWIYDRFGSLVTNLTPELVPSYARLEVENTQLSERLETRKVVERAKGILMKVKGLTEDEAYVLMRSTAMREKKKIGEIAQSIPNIHSL